MAYDLQKARRIVVKIGSSLLVDADGNLRQNWLSALAADLSGLLADGKEIVVVSSGAVALGAKELGGHFDRQRLRDSQAAAAIGQIRLAHAYQEILGAFDLRVAQILLTLDDTEVRRRYLNARDTIEALLAQGVVPVINENDTVATSEIRYGDNDRLAARVAQMVFADCLVILSDVDGLYAANPEDEADAAFVDHVAEINDDIEAMAGSAKAVGVGSGGMVTKVAAAKIAVPSGCQVLIVNGTHDHPLRRYQETRRGTWFEALESPATARKQWIAGALKPAGTLTIDGGAERALKEGKSLLPAGVTDVDGDFERGDAVDVANAAGHALGRGLVAYSAEEARQIMGRRSDAIEQILGYRDRGELIHRDHLVLLQERMMTIAEIVRSEEASVEDIVRGLGAAAQGAARTLSSVSTETKNKALRAAAAAIRARTSDILAANAKDMASAKSRDLTPALLDRLLLNEDRIEGMARGLDDVADLDDPVGAVMDAWDRPNGLNIARVRVPLGVIGIIYESRPNVTADAGALCLKAGNAAILRGGTEAVHSNHAIMSCLQVGLAEAELPAASIQLMPTQDREAVGAMLQLAGVIDVVIPRGGRSLIERVQNDARVPIFAHLDGICHTYIHEGADVEDARRIVLNAKMRRTGICGTTETLLVDRSLLETHLRPIVSDLIDAGCEVRGDDATRALDDRILPASEEDWGMEYLDSIISVRTVDDIDQAMDHIARHGSSHTEAIVTNDQEAAERFLNEVGSAIVMHNTSTQFADGGEFGMGAEIGISTGKMHARGPVGVEQLTSFKYVVRGQGQVRP